MATETELSSLVNDAISVGVALSEPKAFGVAGGPASAPFLVVPKGYAVHDLSALYPNPYRRKGAVALLDVESFIEAVNDQKTDATRLYGVIRPTPSFKAVFNDHGGADHADAAGGWRDHVATYSCPLSTEWQAWIGKNKVSMTQQAFAEFVEDNELDILEPESDKHATMKEVARDFEATNNAAVTQSTRLDNGQVQFAYNENINGTVKKGQFAVPESFRICIPVFEGGEKITMPVRFRYRLRDGSLTMFYDIVRPHKVLEDATLRVWSAIEGGTGLTALHGG